MKSRCFRNTLEIRTFDRLNTSSYPLCLTYTVTQYIMRESIELSTENICSNQIKIWTLWKAVTNKLRKLFKASDLFVICCLGIFMVIFTYCFNHIYNTNKHKRKSDIKNLWINHSTSLGSMLTWKSSALFMIWVY